MQNEKPIQTADIWSILGQATHDVVSERVRQVRGEGYSPARDDKYKGGQLALASAAYAMASTLFGKLPAWLKPSAVVPRCWPWARSYWKPSSRRACLVKSAALALAEIERIDRAESRKAAKS